MKLRRYFFGYLFVRLAKLLACLALLAMIGMLVRTVISYGIERSRVAYERNGDLDRQLHRLEEELDFTTRELGHITDTTKLPAVKIGRAGDSMRELEANDAQLAQGAARRDRLKEMLTESFEAKAGQLRDRITSVIREIERLRAETAPKPSTDSQPAPRPAPVRAFTPASSNSAIPRTVYGDLSSQELGGMLDSIRDTASFFRALSQKAEKEESRALIDNVIKDLDVLIGWLPAMPKSASPADRPVPDSEPPRVSPAPQAPQEPPPDPLVTAQQNLTAISQAVESIKRRLLRGWTLDAILDQTQSQLERERTHCRLADLALRRIWLDHAVQFGIYLSIGVAIAFLILVFADFIQSFFDTATNTRTILAHIRNENDSGGPS